MKQFWLTLVGVFAGLVLFFVVLPVGFLLAASAVASAPRTPSQTVLYVDLRGGMTDQSTAAPFASLTGEPLSVTTLVLVLRQAQADPKVKSLFVRLPEAGIDPAAADELVQAFRRFKAAGKIIYAHSQGLYASGLVTSTYQLGAEATQLWMQPGAPFEATGITQEEIFFARAFQQYGVSAEFEQRGPYKNAVNPYLYSGFTPAHREAELGWMTAVFNSTIASVAASRHLSEPAVRAAIVGGPYDAAGAKATGLIDRTGQVEEMEDAALDAAGENSVFVDISDYRAPRRGGGGARIAVVNVEGEINVGDSGSTLLGETSVGSDTIAGALRDAAEDDAVKAIVLRVSSPGGADTAAEQIAAAVRAAKAAKKPVVVSMGSYAASGGYWISAEADYIVAQPTTLTGSIGVYGGKFSGGKAAARFGVDLDQITVGGDYTGMSSLGAPMSENQRAAYSAQVDRIYDAFIDHVAKGRNIPAERVREIAGGRVWTGVEAKQLGLVDELGGLSEAIEKAKSLAHLKGSVRLEMLPIGPSPYEALQRMLGISATSAKGLIAAGALLGDERAQAMIRSMTREGAGSRQGRVLAPKPLN